MSKLALTCMLTLLTAARGQEREEPAFAVVVNVANECKLEGEAVTGLVKKLFLKQLTKWPDGLDARPYARERGAEQAAFLQQVLCMEEAELARHWLKMKTMNGTTPPRSVGSDRMLLKYVEKHDGAFGVVALDVAREAAGVRILCTF